MRVAVTGSAGFIGRHLMKELAARAVEPVAVVRRPSQLAAADPGCTAVAMDIASPPADAYERLGRPDALIHLAWGGLPDYGSPHHLESELPSHCRFLEGLVEAGLPSLLVTGTCFEYGMRSGALSEELEPLPANPYGQAKDALRRALESLRERRPFALTWARLFYTYGPGQSPRSLFPQLQKAVERGDRVFGMSKGEQLRDYLPVGRLAEILAELALNRRDLGTVNVCSGNPVTVRSLVEGWLRENGWRIELDLGHYPYPPHEPMAFWGDAAKLHEILRSDRCSQR